MDDECAINAITEKGRSATMKLLSTTIMKEDVAKA